MSPFLSSRLRLFSQLPLRARGPRDTSEPDLELLTAWKEKQITTRITPSHGKQVSKHRGSPEEDASSSPGRLPRGLFLLKPGG